MGPPVKPLDQAGPASQIAFMRPSFARRYAAEHTGSMPTAHPRYPRRAAPSVFRRALALGRQDAEVITLIAPCHAALQPTGEYKCVYSTGGYTNEDTLCLDRDRPRTAGTQQADARGTECHFHTRSRPCRHHLTTIIRRRCNDLQEQALPANRHGPQQREPTHPTAVQRNHNHVQQYGMTVASCPLQNATYEPVELPRCHLYREAPLLPHISI